MKITKELMDMMVSGLATDKCIKHLEGKAYLRINKMVLDKKGVVLYASDVPVIRFDAQSDPAHGDTFTIEFANGTELLGEIKVGDA